MIKNLIVIVLIVLAISCGNNQNQSTEGKDSLTATSTEQKTASGPDLTGEYSLPAGGCDIRLIIKKEGDVFKYNFKGKDGIIDMEGSLVLTPESDFYYVTFDGQIENNAPKSVEGQFKGNTITIQNSGNSMNNYQVFSDCGEKYLEFTRK